MINKYICAQICTISIFDKYFSLALFARKLLLSTLFYIFMGSSRWDNWSILYNSRVT